MKEWYLVNNGKIEFPKDFSKIFSSDGKYLISRFYGMDYYFEMSGESMYSAIKGLEKETGLDYSEYRGRIVKAIIDRMESCNGILSHKSLVPGKIDTQLRATNSALRVLIQAYLDGYGVLKELEQLLPYHFQFYMEWGGGVWFCHDQSEYEKEIRKCQLKTTVWDKEKYNTLTLNTHLDSLNTLLILIKNKNQISIGDYEIYENLLYKGVTALNTLIKKDTNGIILSALQHLDKRFYLLHKKNNPIFHFIVRAFDRFVHPFFFKNITPVFFFNYGYIARDLAVKSRHMDYLPTNIADLLRFYSLLERDIVISKAINLERLKTIIDKAVSLLFELDSLYLSENDQAWKCEIKILSRLLCFGYVYPETWKELHNGSFSMFSSR